jgi:hypothetical protein
MKTNWKAIGIAAVSAAILYYPALKLYQYITKRREEDVDEGDDHHVMKAFSPAYRGRQHKPHHRTAHNGPIPPEQA